MIQERIEAAIKAVDDDLQAHGYSGLDEEQRAVMRDRYEGEQAIGMLDDLRDRVGGISDATWTLAVSTVIEHTTFSPDQRDFVDARILQAVREIAPRLSEETPFYPGGPVPSAALVREFSDLHSFCDANELGGLCDPEISSAAERLFPERSDPETVHSQAWMSVANQIQNAVSEWLSRPAGSADDRWNVAEMRLGSSLGDFAVPVGWWGVSMPDTREQAYERGLYQLRVEPGSETNLALDLRDEQGAKVTTIFRTADRLLMHACLLTLPPSPDYLAMERRHRPLRGNF